MARPKTSESRKAKPTIAEELTHGIEQLRELGAQIDDLSREGFPTATQAAPEPNSHFVKRSGACSEKNPRSIRRTRITSYESETGPNPRKVQPFSNS